MHIIPFYSVNSYNNATRYNNVYYLFFNTIVFPVVIDFKALLISTDFLLEFF